MKRSAGFTYIEALIVLAITAILAAVVVSSCEEAEAWSKYAAENNCQLISTERGTYYHVPDGKGGTSLHRYADRKTYRCENGTTHTR